MSCLDVALHLLVTRAEAVRCSPTASARDDGLVLVLTAAFQAAWVAIPRYGLLAGYPRRSDGAQWSS